MKNNNLTQVELTVCLTKQVKHLKKQIKNLQQQNKKLTAKLQEIEPYFINTNKAYWALKEDYWALLDVIDTKDNQYNGLADAYQVLADEYKNSLKQRELDCIRTLETCNELKHAIRLNKMDKDTLNLLSEFIPKEPIVPFTTNYRNN